jgi:hypothetical protein
MQLVGQRNSLNRHDVTDQEIAELSEILTVQENKGGAPIANRVCTCHGLRGGVAEAVCIRTRTLLL